MHMLTANILKNRFMSDVFKLPTASSYTNQVWAANSTLVLTVFPGMTIMAQVANTGNYNFLPQNTGKYGF